MSSHELLYILLARPRDLGASLYALIDKAGEERPYVSFFF